MPEILTKTIHDIATGEIVEIPLSKAEIEQKKNDDLFYLEQLKIAENKKLARIELLNRLGLTEDEAKLLLS